MQLELPGISPDLESPEYLTDQLITYLGNKRTLIRAIDSVVEQVRDELRGRRIRSADLFSGSGVVSRMLKKHSSYIAANDLEFYASIVSRAYLTNREEVEWEKLEEAVQRLNKKVLSGGGPKGFIAEMYAPKDDRKIKRGERVFYTSENARRLDAFAQLIRKEDPKLQELLLAPLLSSASVHANTGGVFKGFYKDARGVGRFGGSGDDALSRIKKPIELRLPVISKFSAESEVFQSDAAEVASKIKKLDFVYLDPPYNQHPYGSNYFMLNLIADYKRPKVVSEVSGIPENWNRSDYNKRNESFSALSHLVDSLDSRFILLSFSDDGFLDPSDLQVLFNEHGKTERYDITYNTYRASRNLSGRSQKLTEHLFLLDRSKK
jgi:adenine-specific DNA-methyltransferase